MISSCTGARVWPSDDALPIGTQPYNLSGALDVCEDVNSSYFRSLAEFGINDWSGGDRAVFHGAYDLVWRLKLLSITEDFVRNESDETAKRTKQHTDINVLIVLKLGTNPNQIPMRSRMRSARFE
jgi:hypothetical protein